MKKLIVILLLCFTFQMSLYAQEIDISANTLSPLKQEGTGATEAETVTQGAEALRKGVSSFGEEYLPSARKDSMLKLEPEDLPQQQMKKEAVDNSNVSDADMEFNNSPYSLKKVNTTLESQLGLMIAGLTFTDPGIASMIATALAVGASQTELIIQAERSFLASLDSNSWLKSIVLPAYQSCKVKKTDMGWMQKTTECMGMAFERTRGKSFAGPTGGAGEAVSIEDSPEIDPTYSNAQCAQELGLTGSAAGEHVTLAHKLFCRALAPGSGGSTGNPAKIIELAKSFIQLVGNHVGGLDASDVAQGNFKVEEGYIKPELSREKLEEQLVEKAFEQVLSLMSQLCNVSTVDGDPTSYISALSNSPWLNFETLPEVEYLNQGEFKFTHTIANQLYTIFEYDNREIELNCGALAGVDIETITTEDSMFNSYKAFFNISEIIAKEQMFLFYANALELIRGLNSGNNIDSLTYSTAVKLVYKAAGVDNITEARKKNAADYVWFLEGLEKFVADHKEHYGDSRKAY